MADYVSGEEKCEARKDVDADTVRGYVTFQCGLPSGHPGSHQAERVAGGPLIWEQSAEHTPQTDGPGMQPCGNVGPFDGRTCIRPVGHSGYHEHPCAGMKMVWSDVTDESVAKQLAALQRKVRAQANQINKLEELRRAAVAAQPEYQALKRDLEAQASLTERENRFRRKAEQLLDHERNRRGELIGSLLMDIRSALGDPVDSVPPSWATWSELRKQVGRLINELDKHRVRANARKAELDKLNVRLTDPFDPRMFLGPSAEYGTTPLAARVAELAKRVNELEHETVRRCESRNSGTRCVGYPRHAGDHSGPGTERWA